MAMHDFWRKWRAELLRGSVIFVGVVAVGLAIVSAVRKGADRARNIIPQLAQSFNASLGGGFDDPGRHHGDTWSWHSHLNAGQTLALRSLNGPVEVTAAPGTETLVTVEKSWMSSDPGVVTIQAIPTSSGTMICAIWPGSNGTDCSAGHNLNIHMNGREHNDVAVKFVVQLARGVKIDVGSIAGDVNVSGATAGVAVNTVSGDLSVETTSWPVSLSTVSGDISAQTGAPGAEPAKVASVSGDVSLSIPSASDVVVHANSVSGDIQDDFDIPVEEAKYGPSHSMSGTVGKGGAQLDLNTVSGDISLNKGSSVTIVRLKKKHGVTVVAPAIPIPPVAPVARP
jgi:hypothetical protein